MRTVGDRLVVTGDVDLDGRDAIGPTLLAAAACPAPCVVDLTSVRYLSSAGVALLAEAAALAGPRLSIVVAPGSAPARVCALTGLGAVVPWQRRTSWGRHRIGSAARSNWRASPVRGDHRVPQAGHSERDHLQNAQGEDAVAGIRNTVPLAQLEEIDKSSYDEPTRIMASLEGHYRDLCDIEFTIERGTLRMLQTRVGKRTAAAAFRIATQLVDEGLIDADEAVRRVSGAQLVQLMFPWFDSDGGSVGAKPGVLGRGMSASPGAAVGRRCSTPTPHSVLDDLIYQGNTFTAHPRSLPGPHDLGATPRRPPAGPGRPRLAASGRRPSGPASRSRARAASPPTPGRRTRAASTTRTCGAVRGWSCPPGPAGGEPRHRGRVHHPIPPLTPHLPVLPVEQRPVRQRRDAAMCRANASPATSGSGMTRRDSASPAAPFPADRIQLPLHPDRAARIASPSSCRRIYEMGRREPYRSAHCVTLVVPYRDHRRPTCSIV